MEEDSPREVDDPQSSLRPLSDPKNPSMAAPMAAMAEALRANAEALRRIDASQRKMAESIERSDRASQVVASTRALNETFRGLSEIQRGLLDAVVHERGRQRGSPVVVGFALLAVAVLAGLLGVLVSEKWLGEDSVSSVLYEDARSDADELGRKVGELEMRVETGRERDREAERRLAEKDRALAELDRDKKDLEEREEELKGELESNRARVENYVEVKDVAEQAGQIQMRNMQLEKENRELRSRLDSRDRERENFYELLGEKIMELRGGDPQAIIEQAKKDGLIKDPPARSVPGGPTRLTGRGKRLVLDLVNRLLPDADEAYEVVEVTGIADGFKLRDVTIGRYIKGRLVNSLKCKELTIRADEKRDTIELRLVDGHIINTRRPSEKIPLGEDGHFIPLTEVGLKDWLRRASLHVRVGEDGRLTWKSTPS